MPPLTSRLEFGCGLYLKPQIGLRKATRPAVNRYSAGSSYSICMSDPNLHEHYGSSHILSGLGCRAEDLRIANCTMTPSD